MSLRQDLDELIYRGVERVETLVEHLVPVVEGLDGRVLAMESRRYRSVVLVGLGGGIIGGIVGGIVGVMVSHVP